MPEAIFTKTDPITGREFEVRTETKTLPPEIGMNGIDWSAVQTNIKNFGVDETMKAVEAAIQFQGLRGYQNALKSGESPEKAMVKYGPMIFNKQASSFAPSMRALTPPVARPVNALEQARIDEIKRRANLPIPARSASPGSAIFGADGKIISQVPSAAQTRAQDEQFDTVREEYEDRVVPPDITPGIPPRGKWNPFVSNVPAVPPVTNREGYTIPRHTITRKIPRGAGASNAPPVIRALAEQSDLGRANPVVVEIELAPTNPSDRVEGKKYKSSTGKIGTWTKSGWKVK